MISKIAGCKYVKIKKKNPNICVSEKQKNNDTPWCKMKYINYKKKIEFNEEQIKDLII
tara:strand:- start:969 stop:1142 length:174 start_codon:yes stop_codon:yes gene_type:complete